MAYDTDGGGWGGAARGLEAGLSLGSSMYNAQANRDLEKQKMGQEAGYQNKMVGLEGQRVGIEGQKLSLDAQKAQSDALQQDISSLTAKASAAQGHEQEMLQQELAQQQDKLRQLHDHSFAQTAITQYDKTLQTAGQLANHQTSIKDLPAAQVSNVVAAAHGQPAVDVIDGDHNDHPEGRSKWGQHYDEFTKHMYAGNLPAAQEANFPIVAPFISALPQDHDSYFSGLSAGDHGMQQDDPNYANRHIAQQLDVTGRMGAANAAANSDPEIQKKVMEAHDDGQTDQQRMFFQGAAQAGGVNGLRQLAQPTPEDQSYQQKFAQAKADGANDDDAHADAKKAVVKETLEQVMDRRRMWYANNGYELPKDLQLSEQEKAAAALEAAGYPAKQAKLMAYSPAYAAEQMKAQVEAPVRAADINLKNAQANYTNSVKGQQTIAVTGTDGLPYSRHPDGTLTDPAGAPAPAGVGVSARVGTANQNQGGGAWNEKAAQAEATKQAQTTATLLQKSDPDYKPDVNKLAATYYASIKSAHDQEAAAAKAAAAGGGTPGSANAPPPGFVLNQ